MLHSADFSVLRDNTAAFHDSSILQRELSGQCVLYRLLIAIISDKINETEPCVVVACRSWWFGIDRREADKQLMLPGNPRGTFLIRKSGGGHTADLTVDVSQYSFLFLVFLVFVVSFRRLVVTRLVFLCLRLCTHVS